MNPFGRNAHRSALAALVALAPLGSARAQELGGEPLSRWLERILPRPEETRWTAIPWRASLLEAWKDGAASAQPILLWAMNGHPLGCT